MEDRYFIFTELVGSSIIGRNAISTFHQHHKRKLNIFIGREDVANIPENPNNIIHILEDDDNLRKLINNRQDNLGLALLWANLIQKNPTKKFIHFDSDTIFLNAAVDRIIEKMNEGYDLVGPIKNYKNNNRGRDDVRKYRDIVHTYCCGFNGGLIDKSNFMDLLNYCSGTGYEHPVIDFFDPVQFQILKNGGRVAFMDINQFGGELPNGTRMNRFPILNIFADVGDHIIHFRGANLGWFFYNQIINKKEMKVAQYILNDAISMLDVYFHVFFRKKIAENNGKMALIKHFCSMLGLPDPTAEQAAETKPEEPTVKRPKNKLDTEKPLNLFIAGYPRTGRPSAQLIEKFFPMFSEIKYTRILEEADLCINSNMIHYPFDEKYNIELTLRDVIEDAKKNDILIGGQFNSDNTIQLPPFIRYIYNYDTEKIMTRLTERPTRTAETIPKKFCCFIVTNEEGPQRNMLFQFLNKAKPVDSLGKYKNNVDVVCTHHYSSDEYRELISQYKFVIAFERKKETGLITERIVNAFEAGVIPIYWGTPAVFNYFNKNAFIAMDDKKSGAIRAVIDRIMEIDGDDNKYLEMVNTAPLVSREVIENEMLGAVERFSVILGKYVRNYKQKRAPLPRDGVKIYYEGFVGYDPPKYLADKIFAKFGGVKKVDRPEDCDVYFSTVWTTPDKVTYPGKYNVHITGESYIINEGDHRVDNNDVEVNYDLILSPQKDSGKNIDLPYIIHHVYAYGSGELLDQLEAINKRALEYAETGDKTLAIRTAESIPSKFCAFIVSNPRGVVRNLMFQTLNKKKSVDSLGKYKNNVGKALEIPFHSPEYIEFLRDYKFIIAGENANTGTYITEKILNPLLAGIIPIYWGTSYVFEIFNKDRFLYLDTSVPDSFNKMVERILELDADEEKYLEMVNRPIFVDYAKFRETYSLEGYADKVDAILGGGK
jgi:hypothetical protein